MTSKTSKIIADLRKQKDWSQTELATNSGVSREMIGKYERGEAVPSIDAAKKIADAFEVSMDYLVGEGVNVSFDKKILNACRILRSWMMPPKINSTSLLITSCKISKLKKRTLHKIQKPSVEGSVILLIF